MASKHPPPPQTESFLFSSPLTIDQLDDVISLLVKCGFTTQKKWRTLGLKLGLDRKTFADIAEKHSEVKDCFNECIARWLRRGGATLDSLSEALRSLFQIAVADKLDQERKPIRYVRPKSTEGTRVPRAIEGIEHPHTSGPDSHKSKNRQKPGTGKINALKGTFECGPSKEGKVRSKDAASAKPLEYMTLKEASADIIDLLAGNPAVINPLANHLFSSHTIPGLVQRDVTNTLSTPAERAEKLMNSLLAIMQRHHDPSSVISSIITSLQKVELTFMADRLEEKLNLRALNPVPEVRKISKVGEILKRFEEGKLEEVKDEGKSTLATSSECISMMSADLVDLIAGNAPVISPLNDDLLSLYIIPKSVFLDVADTSCSPAERAMKLVIPLLEIIEKHPDPSSAISSFITSLRKADLNFIADKLEKKPNDKKELPDIQSKTVVIELSTKDEVIRGLEDLNHLLSGIIEKLKNQFQNLIASNELKLQDIASHIEKSLEANLKKGTLDNIFTSIRPYCDSLNYTLIRSLVQNLIPEGDELQNDLCRYINGIEKLSRSSQMKHLQSATSPALPLLCRTNEQIVIKFHKRWEVITISCFNDTLQHYFKECHADCCYKTFDSLTTLSIMLSIVKSQAENFIKMVEGARKSLERIGILEIAIGQRKLVCVRRDDNNFNISLRQSVKAGDSFEVSMLLQLGADPNNKNKGEKSAVEIAIEGEGAEHIHVIKALLNGGASFFSVLISAITKNKERVVKMLIDAGIDVNLQGSGKETALIVAARCNQEEIVHFLLQQKAIIIDKADNLGYTALHYACREGSEDNVKYLLEKNANIHLHTKNSSLPLTLATEHEQDHIVELLLPKSTKDEIDKAIEVARTLQLQWLLITQKDRKYVPSLVWQQRGGARLVPSPNKSTTIAVKGKDVEITGLTNFEKCQASVDKWKDSRNIVIRESSSESVSFIVSHVLKNQKAKGLTIDGSATPLTRDSVNSFSAELKSNQSLWRLIVTNDSITDDGLEVLEESIESSRHLNLLALYGNPSIRSAESLAKLIETNTSLTYLSVWNTSISGGGVLRLLEALKKNKHLVTLVLDDKDEETCRSSPLYQDVEHRLIFKTTHILSGSTQSVVSQARPFLPTDPNDCRLGNGLASENIQSVNWKEYGIRVTIPQGAVLSETFSIFGASTQSVNWEEYGIKITIPQGAVLPSDTVQVTITALVGRGFIFPEDTELVSAVYAISLSKPFLEPVKLEIQHCASIKTPAHGNDLSFSTTTDNEPPYKFNTVDGGKFLVGNRYGSISTAKFSKWSVVMKRRIHVHPYCRENLPSNRASDTSEENQLMVHIPVEIVEDESPVKLYFGQVIYEVRIAGREWLMRFLLSQDLNALIEHIKKEFKSFKEYMEISFKFEDYDGYIELHFDYEQIPKGWSVRPHQCPSKVSQNVIDEYGSISPPHFPKCVFTITATPGKGTVKELNYPITLQGIKSDTKKINIVLTMGDFQQKSAGTIASPSGSISPEERQLQIAGEVLQNNFDILSKILAAASNLSDVIMSLYAKRLITNSTSTECMNTGKSVIDRCASLLFALQSTVTTQPQAMLTLIGVLKGKEAFKSIAENMDLQYQYHLNL